MLRNKKFVLSTTQIIYKEFNVKMNYNPNFKLNDARTWKL